MGSMRFSVYDRDRIPSQALSRVYMCGQDDVPFFARVYFNGNHLIIERSERESGNVYVPWRIEGHGERLCTTTSLMERERPYQLEVELARGGVFRLRNQMAAWEVLGLEVPEKVRDAVKKATGEFSLAATSQARPAEAARHAAQALTASADAANLLSDAYASQAISMRRGAAPRLPTLLGIQLDRQLPTGEVARELTQAFNLVALPLTWKDCEVSEGQHDWQTSDAQIEWCRQNGLRVGSGPLLQLDDRGTPDWAYLWEGKFERLLEFMLGHVRKTVQRYRGKVHLWQVASRLCCGRALTLSEEDRLQIVAQALSLIRELDPKIPAVVTFDQPWAEFMANERTDLAPLLFADALARADLGLSGVGIELNIGYTPRGSAYRIPLAYSRLVDYWSMLELPLLISLVAPSSAKADPQADSAIYTLGKAEGLNITPESQSEWVERHLPIFLAKNAVQVILWSQLSDAASHEFPHGGMFDTHGTAKPALAVLKNKRSLLLN